MNLTKKSKYFNSKSKVDNITFDSAKESRRYSELLFLQKVGLISNLELQKPFVICDQFFSKSTNSIVKPIKYVCDFFYFDKDLGGWVIEDVKGFKTDVYNLKKKLLLKKLNDSDSGDTIIFKES